MRMILSEISHSHLPGVVCPVFHNLSNQTFIGETSMFTIIARDCGIDRNYPCYTYAEAEFLFKALSAIAHRVECWQGASLVMTFTNN